MRQIFNLARREAEWGQTLLEVLVALSVGVLVLVAMTAVILSSLSNAQFSKNQNLATLFAQQGMEMVRDLRNKNWTSFAAYDGFYCLAKDGSLTAGSNCAGNIDGFFTRQIRFENLAVDKRRITVTVSFTDSKGEHKSELISIFTNWNVQ